MAVKITIVNEYKRFEEMLSKSKIPLFVNFHADWCGPCKMILPHFSEISKEFEGKIKFLSVDVEKSKDIVDKVKVFSLPTLILFSDSKEVARIKGFNNKEKLKKFLMGNLNI